MLLGRLREVLREQVGRVQGPEHLEDAKVASSNTLLYPQLAHREVPHLADASPLHNPQRSTRVRVELQKAGDAQVQHEGPEAQGLRGALDDACELCLPAGQGDDLLGRAPGLYRVRPMQRAAA